MEDKNKTQKQLIRELTTLRQRIAELEGTGRKQVDEEIERLASFPKLNPIPIVEVDQKGQLTYTNTAAQKIFPDLDKRQGKHPFLAGLKSYFSELQQKKQKYLIREVEVGSNWYSQIISLAEPEYIRIYATDITERKQVENTSRETSLFLKSILDSSSSISIIFTDLEQNILFWNKGAENIFGYKSEEVVDRHTVDILYPDERDTKQTVEEIRSYILNKKRGVHREIKEITKDGRILWISLTSTPRFDEKGNVIGILGIGEDITKRKRVEKTLEEEEARFKHFFEHEPAYCYIISPEGVIFDVNNAALGVLGYKKEEVVGKPLQTIYAPESLPKMEQLYSKWKKTGQLKDEEMVVITRKGERRTVLLSAGAVKDSDGKILHSISVQKDITERKQVEDELRESEERHRTLFEHAGVAITLYDSETGKRIAFNTMAHESLGYTREEFQELTAADITVRKDPEHFKQRIKGIIEKGSKLYELQLVTKNGEIREVLVSAVSIRMHGKILIQMIRVDITDQKRAEQALRESEEKYRELINGMNDTAWVIDFDGKFIDVNYAAVEMLGYSREELLTMGPHDIDSSLDAKKITGLIKRMRKDKLQVFETAHTTKDGKAIPVEIKSSLITYQGKQAILSIARDITERKGAEQERLAHLQFLESMDRVNRAMQGTNDLEQMMSDVLGVVLDMFDCDRAGLVYPCDPEAASWKVPMERTRPEYPGAHAFGIEIPMDPDVAQTFRITRDSSGPVRFGPESEHPLPPEVAKRFGFKSLIKMALYPKVGKPWEFILHQCSYPRVWTPQEERLFQEIGRRLADGLTSLLVYRDLQESELRYRELFENTSDVIMITEVSEDGRLKLLDLNPAWGKMIGLNRTTLLGRFLEDFDTDETTRKTLEICRLCLEKEAPIDHEMEMVTPTGHWYVYTTLIPVRNAAGNIYRIVGVGRNITERKRAEEELKRNYQQMQEMLVTVVNALASTVEMKDQYTAGHQPRVTQLACAIAAEMGLSEEQIEGIHMAGLIHDIGKIMVPAEILNKPGPLSEIQYEMVKMHPQAGYDIVKDIKFPWPVAQMVLQHHELMDGSGYPQELSGEEIMVEAKILTVANVVEAMVSHRPYRAAFNIKEALAEISKNKGSLYDPAVVDACLKLFNNKRFTFKQVQ